MKSIETFQDRLQAAMKNAGHDQSSLARELGTSPGTVWEWASNGGLPKGNYMTELPRILGCSGHWLLTGALPIEPPGVALDAEATYRAGWNAAVSASRRLLDRMTDEGEATIERPLVAAEVLQKLADGEERILRALLAEKKPGSKGKRVADGG